MALGNARRLYRLDSPTGPLVYLLATAGDGWVKVMGARLQISFDTRAERLHIPLK